MLEGWFVIQPMNVRNDSVVSRGELWLNEASYEALCTAVLYEQRCIQSGLELDLLARGKTWIGCRFRLRRCEDARIDVIEVPAVTDANNTGGEKRLGNVRAMPLAKLFYCR